MNSITMSGIIVTLFLGGPQPLAFGDWTADIPFIPNGLEGVIWFVLKLFIFLYIYVWLRATLPRLRYDQLMDLGWKALIPISLGWFLLLGRHSCRQRQRLEHLGGRDHQRRRARRRRRAAGGRRAPCRARSVRGC